MTLLRQHEIKYCLKSLYASPSLSGNIALHIMKPDIREEYDLETLWTVGAQFDDKCQEVDENPMDLFNAMGHFTNTADSSEKFIRP